MQADTRSGSGEPELQIGCLSELLNGRIRAGAVSNRAYRWECLSELLNGRIHFGRRAL